MYTYVISYMLHLNPLSPTLLATISDMHIPMQLNSIIDPSLEPGLSSF